MAILTCPKCGGTIFHAISSITYSVYVINGAPGGTTTYQCDSCGTNIIVERPATHYDPHAIELPEGHKIIAIKEPSKFWNL